VNLGNSAEFSIAELAGKIINLTGSASKIISKPLPSDDPKLRKPDISLAKKLLDWEPAVAVDDGLLKTIEYFDRLLEGTKNLPSMQDIQLQHTGT
jgi:UDP-glucuronate decarboxylase